MAYDIGNIIQTNIFLTPAELGFGNFASIFLFAPESEKPAALAVDTFHTYSSLQEMSTAGWLTTTETYEAASAWLGGIPTSNQITVYIVDDGDANWAATLDKARNMRWWFWTALTSTIYADAAQVGEVAAWCLDNESVFINCQSGASATSIRDASVSNDVASTLTAAGNRYVYTHAHLTDQYAGIRLAKWYAAVNYAGLNTTLTGDGKVLSGVVGEDLPTSENNAMITKRVVFYSRIDNQGSIDPGRVVNSITHSANREYIDDVVNLEAFRNNLRVTTYNAIQNQLRKLGQDPRGQSVLLSSARNVCEQYITNGYLGPRNYIDPDTGETRFTRGYEILTQPDDILNITDTQRANRESAAMRLRIFRRGAIHNAAVDIDIF